jgi:hypothetical protein
MTAGEAASAARVTSDHPSQSLPCADLLVIATASF